MYKKMRPTLSSSTDNPVQSPSRRNFLCDSSKLAGLVGTTSLLVPSHNSAQNQNQTRNNELRNVPTGNNYLIRGAYIVSMDNTLQDKPAADILIRDGVIVEISESIDATHLEVIEANNMIAIPGFVDTHWHLWNSTLKNMLRPDKTTPQGN